MFAIATQDGPIGVLTMHDPARRNALGAEMISQLRSGLDHLNQQDARVIILRAAPGDRVWSAGFDIAALGPGIDPLVQDGPLMGLFHAVADCPAPVIAMLDGSAWGGGTDLALRCDILLASPACTLAFTPARLGLPYDPEGLQNVLLRAGRHIAMEMFATAEPIQAGRALQVGLLNHVVPAGEIEAFTMAMAHRIAALAPLSVRSAKQQLGAINAALALPAAELARLQDGRRRALHSEDFKAGLAAFHARQTPVFTGT